MYTPVKQIINCGSGGFRAHDFNSNLVDVCNKASISVGRW